MLTRANLWTAAWQAVVAFGVFFGLQLPLLPEGAGVDFFYPTVQLAVFVGVAYFIYKMARLASENVSIPVEKIRNANKLGGATMVVLIVAGFGLLHPEGRAILGFLFVCAMVGVAVATGDICIMIAREVTSAARTSRAE